MRKAVYPGSFDPISTGHLDLIKRASKLFDELHILVSYNMFNKSSFSVNDSIEMINECVKDLKNVIVVAWDGLVVQYCKENNINIIIRGMRNYSDFENEFTLFQYNRDIYPNIETILLMPTTKNQVVSSSAIKELVEFDCSISKYVPKCIEKRIIEGLKKNK